MITADECECWLHYRDYRNEAGHRYGENYAEEVLAALPAFFIEEAKALSRTIRRQTS